MTIKHTRGPWKHTGNNQSLNNYAEMVHTGKWGPMPLCVIHPRHHGDDTAKANARLIATAPELLEELKDALNHICYLCKIINPQHQNCTSCEDMEIRREAINKAEGEEARNDRNKHI